MIPLSIYSTVCWNLKRQEPTKENYVFMHTTIYAILAVPFVCLMGVLLAELKKKFGDIYIPS